MMTAAKAKKRREVSAMEGFGCKWSLPATTITYSPRPPGIEERNRSTAVAAHRRRQSPDTRIRQGAVSRNFKVQDVEVVWTVLKVTVTDFRASLALSAREAQHPSWHNAWN